MHTKTEATTTTTYKPSLMERMRGAKTTRATRPVHTGVTGTRRTPRTTGVTGTRGTTGTTTTTRPTRTTRHHQHGTTTTTGARRAPRKTTLGDKVSGMGLKMKGDATGRPGQKAAGTRRMHGTDGKITRRRKLF